MKTKKRRILYVDASVEESMSKISLYDTGNNLTNILELQNISKSNIAENYALLYAILYVVKNNLHNCHILSDNQQSTQNKKIIKIAQDKSIAISWIPREINVIADKITKLNTTVKIKEWYILDMFYNLIMKDEG